MNNRKHSKRETIVKSLELPQDLFLGVPVFTMNGNRELLVENHKGILRYSSEQMVIRSKAFPIQIIGTNLRIETYTKDSLIVCGNIEGIMLTSC